MPPLSSELQEQVQAIEALPRKERRRLGRRLGVAIPGSNKPIRK